MSKINPDSLVAKTRLDYSKIAADFTRKRKFLTPDLLKLKDLAFDGTKILDVGCGSGRLIEVFKDIKVDYQGVDNCPEFIKIATQTFGPHYKVIDSLTNLPFEESVFDLVFCMATIHHVPGIASQKKALCEMFRVLKPGGKLIITAWDILNNPKLKPLVKKQNALKLIGKSNLYWNDCLVPYTDTVSGEKTDRYVHGFKPLELENIVQSAGFKIINSDLNKRGNTFVNQNIEIIALKPI